MAMLFLFVDIKYLLIF